MGQKRNNDLWYKNFLQPGWQAHISTPHGLLSKVFSIGTEGKDRQSMTQRLIHKIVCSLPSFYPSRILILCSLFSCQHLWLVNKTRCHVIFSSFTVFSWFYSLQVVQLLSNIVQRVSHSESRDNRLVNNQRIKVPERYRVSIVFLLNYYCLVFFNFVIGNLLGYLRFKIFWNVVKHIVVKFL